MNLLLSALVDHSTLSNDLARVFVGYRRFIRIGLAIVAVLFSLSCLALVLAGPFLLSYLLNRACAPLFIH